jgi:hypothetical protein
MLMSTISGPSYTSAAPLYGPPYSSASPLYGRLGCVGCARSWSGGLSGPADIERLQTELRKLAQATGDALYNPCVGCGAGWSGKMNDDTALAVLTVIWNIAGDVPLVKTLKNDLIGNIPGLSTVANTALNNIVLRSGIPDALGSYWGEYKRFVENNAGTLAYAVTALIAKKSGVSLPPPPGSDGTASNPVSMQPMNIISKFVGRGYPAGSIQTFSAKRKKWLIAKPLSGLFGREAATFVTVAEAEEAASGPRTVSNEEFDKLTGGSPGASPWYKTTIGKVGIGAGVAAILGAGYYFFIK